MSFDISPFVLAKEDFFFSALLSYFLFHVSALPHDGVNHSCKPGLEAVPYVQGKRIITFISKVGKRRLLLLNPFKWND